MAQVALIVFLLQAVLMLLLYRHFGYVRLLGLGHFGWFFLIPYLVSHVSASQNEPIYFNSWLYAIIVVNSLSLIIDVVDVIRYFIEAKKG